jgi:ATP-dependent helicase/nuclease subunit A
LVAPLAAEVDHLPRWRALAAFLLTQDDTLRKTVNVRNGFPAGKEFKAQKDAMFAALAEVDEAQLAALVRLRQLPTPGRDGDGGEAIVRALTRLMKLAAAELWLVFREAGEVDFGELATRAIDALGDDMDPSELGLRLDWRIRHLLVDEFQDTSPNQIRLLERLTAGWSAGDGRTLFCVGDPMQSIYRFRKAEVGLFLRAKSHGIGHLPLTPCACRATTVRVRRWSIGSMPASRPCFRRRTNPCAARSPTGPSWPRAPTCPLRVSRSMRWRRRRAIPMPQGASKPSACCR